MFRCMLYRCARLGWWRAHTRPLAPTWRAAAWTTSAPSTPWRRARETCAFHGSSQDTPGNYFSQIFRQFFADFSSKNVIWDTISMSMSLALIIFYTWYTLVFSFLSVSSLSFVTGPHVSSQETLDKKKFFLRIFVSCFLKGIFHCKNSWNIFRTKKCLFAFE